MSGAPTASEAGRVPETDRVPERIVSLLPASTEIVLALGLADRLVGRSFECVGPPEVLAIPPVTRDLLGAATTSRAIDDAVRSAAATGSGTSAVDLDLIAELAPDVILTQDLCDVCAVPAVSLTSLGIPLVTTHPHTLDEVVGSILTVGAALGVPERAAELARSMRSRIDAVRQRVTGLAPRRVVVAEWIDPPFTAGHWIPDMVAAAGGIELLGTAGGRSVTTTWDAIRAAEPELVVLAPCGLDAATAERDLAATGEHLPCPVVAIDADRLTAGPGPSLAAGVERLAELLHGDGPATR